MHFRYKIWERITLDSMLLLAFLSPRSDDEVNQILWRFLRGFLATKEVVDSEGGLEETCCYAHWIEVRCVVRYPSGTGSLSWRDRLG